MIYSADIPEHRWYNVFHVPTVTRLQNVVEVCTDTARYWQLFLPENSQYFDRVEHQAKKIVAYDDQKLILIDPVGDDDDTEIVEADQTVGAC